MSAVSDPPVASHPRRSLFAVWHWPRWTWAVVVVLMLAYPLSIGPAYGLYIRGELPQSIYFAVYRPLIWFAALNANFTDALNWYTSLFRPGDSI